MFGKMARSLISLVERYADKAGRMWVAGMRAEFYVIDGGVAQVLWLQAQFLSSGVRTAATFSASRSA
jgi:hypothetical protein